jgi:hypothetical protein
MHEATNKQIRATTVQDSSGKHPETILKPKDIIQKQVSSCHATILQPSSTILQSSSILQLSTKDISRPDKQTAVANQQLSCSNYPQTIR